MKIGICNDHRGVNMENKIIEVVELKKLDSYLCPVF